MKIAMIGAGSVGGALAIKLAEAGHQVTIAARDLESENVKRTLARHDALDAELTARAVKDAEVVFLAPPFDAVKAALQDAGSLDGKILVDCTNPVGEGIGHALDNEISGGEFVQGLVPGARVVKAFSIYGFENFENPRYPGYGELLPAMLIAGNDPAAKTTVANLTSQLGWQPVDTGDITMSLHLEHMALLWIKMGRIQDRDPGFVWAMLTR